MKHWRLPFNVVASVLGILYPIVVWQRAAVRPLTPAEWLLSICVVRLISTRNRLERGLLIGTGVLAALMTVSSEPLLERLYPAYVNAALLIFFGSGLIWPPTIIERLARLRDPNLPPAAVRYTRKVTALWCGFFVANGAMALGTSLWSSTEVWTLYNGCISYILVGVMFGAEYLVRIRVMRRV